MLVFWNFARILRKIFFSLLQGVLMLIVGELINASRKSIAAAIRERDGAAIQQVARDQVENGAQILDINMDEGLLTLRKGGMVAEMHLVYKAGDQEWQFNLKGESLNLSSLKVPATGTLESRDDIEGAVIEKIDLCNRAVSLINRLYGHFIKLRLGNGWNRNVVPSVRQWINAH